MSAWTGKRPDYYHGNIVFHEFKNEMTEFRGILAAGDGKRLTKACKNAA